MLKFWIVLLIFSIWIAIAFIPKKRKNAVVEAMEIPKEEKKEWIEINWFHNTFAEIKKEIIVEEEKAEKPKVPEDEKWKLRWENWLRTISEYDRQKIFHKQREEERRTYRSPIKGTNSISNPDEALKKYNVHSYLLNQDKVPCF